MEIDVLVKTKAESRPFEAGRERHFRENKDMDIRERQIRRARTFSKRHGETVTVCRVTKGRGKGFYFDLLDGDKSSLHLHKGCVSEVVAVYKNGVRQ